MAEEINAQLPDATVDGDKDNGELFSPSVPTSPSSYATCDLDTSRNDDLSGDSEPAVTEGDDTVKDQATSAHETETFEEDEGDFNKTEILVSEPKKVGDGMSAYIVYKVTTRTNMKHFKRPEMTVQRRFSDFLGLHEKLVGRYQTQGIVIPPPPEKSVVGMTKVKVTKEESGSLDFVEKRRAALERFLNRIVRHPQLNGDTDFVDFVELDGELPKSTSTSTLSGAGLVRLFNFVGDSIGKYTYTMPETDDWFEDKSEQLDLTERDLQDLHTSIEVLVTNRKDLSENTQLFAKSVAVLGSTEEDMSLSRALSQLSDVTSKVSQLHVEQADTDFYVISELIKDYVSIIQSIKGVFHERVKLYRAWKDTEAYLSKKKDERMKLEQQQKTDRLAAVTREISELEQRVVKNEEDFNKMSETIRKELARFDRQKGRDFKATVVNYLQCMMNYQQQVITCWESFLPKIRDST